MKEKKRRSGEEKAQLEAFERDQPKNFWLPDVWRPTNLKKASYRLNSRSKIFSNQEFLKRILSKDIDHSNTELWLRVAEFNGTSKAEDIAIKILTEADKKSLEIFEEIFKENERKRLYTFAVFYKAYKTGVRKNFQSYEELNERVDKFQMEIIGWVLLLIKKNSRPQKAYTFTLHKIVEEQMKLVGEIRKVRFYHN